MRKILAFFCLAALSLSLISCAPASKEGGPVTLNMWVMPNSLEPLKDIEEALKPFEESNPNIKIKITVVDWGAAWSKITTAATSRDVPDIAQLGSTWVGSISSMGALLDLKDKELELGGADSFVPAAWKTSGVADSGQITAVPWIVDARALFYRTDVFKKLNLSSKDLETWDGFKNTLKKIKEAKLTIEGLEIFPLGMPGKNDWNVVHNLSPWIWSAGGDYLAKDNKSSAVSSTQALDGVSFYINLAKEGLVPSEYLELNTAQVSSNFNNGSVAMMFDGPYEVRTLTTPPAQGGASESITARNYAVVPYPKGPKGKYTFVGGSNLAIFKYSKHKEEAFKVVKYLTTDTNAQLTYCKASGFLPAKLSVFNEPFFSVDPARRVFKEAIKYGKSYPCVSFWGILEPMLTRRFGILWDYVTGSKDTVLDKNEIAKQLDLAKKEMEIIIQQGK
ncbi:MAG: extracellular solute-binding protein [Candidatus Saganbacteria bacterium]|uniref:Extracellular solute-binding protein n=1 Tax=Candidatus Saganbacteria bacterium TaxID=2575572 RepID=A0A833L2B3_UNCSA|nr:MAG: extracellular solute-binding protein [Candidatus Saganbacteria bacterium]